MPGPLDALRKAETIGAGPKERLRAQINETPPLVDAPPLPLPAGAVEGLVGWMKGMLPDSITGASRGLQRAASGMSGLPYGAGRAMGTSPAGAADILNPRTAEVMQQMYDKARPVVAAQEATGMFGGDRTVGGLYKGNLPALGEIAPEFTPVGGEAALNAARPTPKVTNPIESVYQRLLLAGGR